MESGRPPALDPASLPPGTRVGPWRLEGWRGRGGYGTVYRARREGWEHAEPVALKLALYPGDERFEREVTLLSRLHHPCVPALRDHGLWQHAGCAYPYLVMQYVEGVPLYAWAATRNPTSRQVLRLLAQLLRALEATHRLGAVHRDVKGDNVLVRLADGRAFLTDFGSGRYPDAAALTWQALPPNTPAYRSPEAWRFIQQRPPPITSYVAHPSDDVFALGVTAYRLVTDEYPPPAEPWLDEAGHWSVEGPGPLPPGVLNPRVLPRLGEIILRMLSLQPEARGTPSELAEAVEHALEHEGPEAEQPLFAWETLPRAGWSREEIAEARLLGHRPRHRVLAEERDSEQRDTAVKAEVAHLAAGKLPRARTPSEQDKPREQVLRWRLGLALAAGALPLLLTWWATSWHPEEWPVVAESEAEDAGTVGLADAAVTTSVAVTEPALSRDVIGLDMPKGPFPGQLRPPCEKGQAEIRGGCWAKLEDRPPDCPRFSFEWKDGCYMPIVSASRPATSDEP